jgi:hypothetical protein
MNAVVALVAFASATLHVPFAAQTVIGQAPTVAHVGETVKVGVFVDATDTGVTEFFTAIPYNPSLLEFTGLEQGTTGDLTARSVSVSSTQASLNVTWKGSLPATESAHLGYAKFTVRRADSSEFTAVGVNSTGKDSTGAQLQGMEVLPSAAVLLQPRPVRVHLQLLVETE